MSGRTGIIMSLAAAFAAGGGMGRERGAIPILTGQNKAGHRVLAPRWSGNSPDDWGRSAYCARMRRKNKLRALGIGGDKR